MKLAFAFATLGAILAIAYLMTYTTQPNANILSPQEIWPTSYTLGEQLVVLTVGGGVGAVIGFTVGAVVVGTQTTLESKGRRR